MKYAVVIEKTESGGYSAYVPALPGFGVAAPTLAGVRELVAEGVPFHLEGLALNGLGVPESKTMTDSVEISQEHVSH